MRWLAALCCGLAISAQAESFSAKVIAVMDGDTIMVLRDGGGEEAASPSSMRATRGGRKIKVRLANIDAPEKSQPFGKQARDSLMELVGRQRVQVDGLAVDQYGRMIGLITVDGLNVNQEQMKRGMAWEYSHYHEDKTYVRLQNEAQQARRGLWVQSSPQAPWLWRKTHPVAAPDSRTARNNSFSAAAPSMQHGAADCGNKHLCSQMNSCDEARFYLVRCRVQTLDRNHDGIPCESLCRGNQ
jgi:micrococcal nuclease